MRTLDALLGKVARIRALCPVLGILLGSSLCFPAPLHGQEPNPHTMISWGLVLDTAASEVQRESYERGGAKPLELHLYKPKTVGEAPLPVVVLAAATRTGTVLHRPQYVDWARAISATGIAAVVFDSEWATHRSDFRFVLQPLRTQAGELGIRADRIGAFACSGNVQGFYEDLVAPENGLSCAVLYYGAPDTYVSPGPLSTLVVSAGRDVPDLNERIRGFALTACSEGSDVAWIHYSDGHHAFDILNDTDRSRAIIRQTLSFYVEELTAPSPPSPTRSASRRALAHYSHAEWAEAIPAYEAFVEEAPGDGLAWQRLGRCHMELERYMEAAEAWLRAADLGRTPATLFYNAACMFSLAGDRDGALDLLERAIEAGYRNAQGMRGDEDLASLRNEARFIELLEAIDS